MIIIATKSIGFFSSLPPKKKLPTTRNKYKEIAYVKFA